MLTPEDHASLKKLAELICQRNAAEAEITKIIGRPAQIGHIGEYVACRIFGISLASSASSKGSDGIFDTGFLRGRSVNIKWYPKLEGLLDLDVSGTTDYYLVLTGPKAPPGSSRRETRPWLIHHVFLFDARQLHAELASRGIKLGVAASLRSALWVAAEIYPAQRNATIVLSEEQCQLLRMFGEATPSR